MTGELRVEAENSTEAAYLMWSWRKSYALYKISLLNSKELLESLKKTDVKQAIITNVDVMHTTILHLLLIANYKSPKTRPDITKYEGPLVHFLITKVRDFGFKLLGVSP